MTPEDERRISEIVAEMIAAARLSSEEVFGLLKDYERESGPLKLHICADPDGTGWFAEAMQSTPNRMGV